MNTWMIKLWRRVRKSDHKILRATGRMVTFWVGRAYG